jgi:hypothetical protein
VANLQTCDRARLYVARTVPLPLPEAAASAASLRKGNERLRAVELPEGGHVDVTLPMRRAGWHPIGRPDLVPARTSGRLRSRKNRIVCPVEIELAAWSRDVTELSLRPAIRSPHTWGARKLGRWFQHAHAAADTLRGELLAHAVTLDDRNVAVEAVAV